MQDSKPSLWDVIIVGGGPAGLNAALVLGRCRRKVLLIDEGKPRNAKSHTLHGFLSRDGFDPAELLEIGRAQLKAYPSVLIQQGRVVAAQSIVSGFDVKLDKDERHLSRKLLLAGGVVDTLPEQPGFDALYGIAVFHCPYCDGWEMRDQPIAVYGQGDAKGAGLALEMTIWNQEIVLCTDGPANLSAESRDQLARHHIQVREEKILHLNYSQDLIPYQTELEIVFASGPPLTRAAIFFNTTRCQSNDLAVDLGCDSCDVKGCVIDNCQQMSNVPGLYIAGDASGEVLQAIVAAAEGVKAAMGINTALLEEDLARV
jgi:thioredoxin reductase